MMKLLITAICFFGFCMPKPEGEVPDITRNILLTGKIFTNLTVNSTEAEGALIEKFTLKKGERFPTWMVKIVKEPHVDAAAIALVDLAVEKYEDKVIAYPLWFCLPYGNVMTLYKHPKPDPSLASFDFMGLVIDYSRNPEERNCSE